MMAKKKLANVILATEDITLYGDVLKSFIKVIYVYTDYTIDVETDDWNDELEKTMSLIMKEL